MVLYLRGHEGRGIGIGQKIAAYSLQDDGADTVDANVRLGLPVDARDYDLAARILQDLGQQNIKLLTNNPAKVEALKTLGINVAEQMSLIVAPNRHNRGYLKAKKERMAHLF